MPESHHSSGSATATGTDTDTGGSSSGNRPRRVLILHTPDRFDAVDLCRGVASYRPHGGPWQLLTLPIDEPGHAAGPSNLLDRAGRLDCDGVIMMPGTDELARTFVSRGIPVVDVDGSVTVDSCCQVRLDNHHIGRLGARHLMDRGFRRLLFIGIDTRWSRERAAGFSAAAAERRVECRVCLTESWTEVVAEDWLLAQLRTMNHPVGVMGCNDQVAARVVEVSYDRGWEVSTRIGVLGVDDWFLACTRLPVPLSSIGTERSRAGAEAARLLDAALGGNGRSSAGGGHNGSAAAAAAASAAAGNAKVWIRPQQVLERQSTAAHVHGDTDVSTAMAFIRARACESISVGDVADHVSLSRSTLDRRFLQHVGRLPAEEIRRVRLQRVKELLEQTDLPLTSIALECGFSSLSSLSHCFRAATGVPPRIYRQQARDTAPRPASGGTDPAALDAVLDNGRRETHAVR